MRKLEMTCCRFLAGGAFPLGNCTVCSHRLLCLAQSAKRKYQETTLPTLHSHGLAKTQCTKQTANLKKRGSLTIVIPGKRYAGDSISPRPQGFAFIRANRLCGKGEE